MTSIGAPVPGVAIPRVALRRRLSPVALGAGSAAILIGALGLIGWWADLPLLRTGVPGRPPMSPNTALAFVVAGGSVLEPAGRWGRAVCRVLAIAPIGIGALTIAEWVIGSMTDIDGLLLPTRPVEIAGSDVERISVQLAVAFMLFGLVRLTAGTTVRWLRRVGNGAAIGFCAVVLAVELGYLFDANELTAGHAISVVAVPSAVALLALVVALLALEADHRPVRWLFERTLTGSVVRRMLPAAVVVPPLLGVLHLQSQDGHWYGARFGMALFIGAMIAVFVAMICYTAAAIARTEQERVLLSQQLATFLDSIPDATVVVDGRGTIRYANGQVTTMLGYPVDELVGQRVEILVPDSIRSGHAAMRAGYNRRSRPMGGLDLTARHRDGHEVAVDISLGPVGTGADSWTLASIRDVTDKRAAQDQLRAAEERYRHLAEHDSLTGLWNRRRFSEELEAHLALCRRGAARGALIAVDLDHFKVVNDTYGHHVGDQLLTSIAHAMRRALRSSDGIARQGGDEFLVLLRSGDDRAPARVAEALVSVVRRTADMLAEQIGSKVAEVTASAGVVVFDQLTSEDLTSDGVLVRADHALYTAKAAGRDRATVATSPHTIAE